MDILTKIVAFFQSEQISAWAVLTLLCVEAFLGQTSLVKAGSTLELVLNGLKKVLGFFKKPEELK